ncbi:MAG: HlyD family efflux transporter periplasmic adaptor subunit [Parabacteroides sp.]|nr:HlyD family efflux transporter periplasmic adaptor subunit [Parabacteroides sp.]
MKIHQYICSVAIGLVLGACTSQEEQYDASGIFETTEVIVSAKGTGELQSFQVEEGQAVRQGEVLGWIDTLQLSLKDRQLAASLLATESKRLDEKRQVAHLRQQIENLQREKERFTTLLNAKATTAKQVDDIDYQIKVLQNQLVATKEQINSSNSSLSRQSESIQAQRAQMEDQIRNAMISSPITGTVLTKYAEQGEFAVPGKALFKVADVSRMKLRAYITADQLTQLQIGQAVAVYADRGTTDRKRYAGRVVWIADKAEFTPKTIQTRNERANLVYAVKIAVENDGFIKRGMYGEVRFNEE